MCTNRPLVAGETKDAVLNDPLRCVQESDTLGDDPGDGPTTVDPLPADWDLDQGAEHSTSKWCIAGREKLLELKERQRMVLNW